jgi:hypothetical protein
MFAALHMMLSETTLTTIRADDCATDGFTAFSWGALYLEIYNFIVVTWTSSHQSTSVFIDYCHHL